MVEEGTGKIDTHPKESKAMDAQTTTTPGRSCDLDPRVEALVTEVIGRVADKWTMLILDLLAEEGEMRFTQIGRKVSGISQKMLTQTLRLMERDGLVVRTVHPVIPPRVEYRLTDLGFSLGEAFCPVWHWANDHLDRIEAARSDFDARLAASR